MSVSSAQPPTLYTRLTRLSWIVLICLSAIAIPIGIKVRSSDDPMSQCIVFGWLGFLAVRLLRAILCKEMPQQLYNQAEVHEPPLGPLLTSRIDSYVYHPTVRYDFDGYSALICWPYPPYDIINSKWYNDRSVTKFNMKYCVAAFKLPNRLPHIFIDGLGQNVMTTSSPNLWALTKMLSKRDKLQDLEGDFPKYFDVYAADRDAVAALSVLTPDVMLRLRDQGYYFDYEIYQDYLYVIAEPNFIRRKGFDAYVMGVHAAVNELIPQISHLNFSQSDAIITRKPAKLVLWGYLYSAKILAKWILLVPLPFVLVFLIVAAIAGLPPA